MVTFANIVLMKTQQNARFAPVSIFVEKLVKRKNSVYGNHSPASRRCPRYRFEEVVVETANNEHISIGSAKRIVMAANSSENSTHASAIKKIKERRK